MMTRPNPTQPASSSQTVPAYEAPAVAWEEDFEPAGQVTGCSDNIGNCDERPEVV
ncbi:MAG: hypothetical protein HY904_07410 [Deltaproteobacteria bacterium]|nr:hypothetical protein [Deltaproteobacteria bacterium]